MAFFTRMPPSDKIITSKSTGSMTIGDVVSVTFTEVWRPQISGTHNVQISLDNADIIPESVETDNKQILKVPVTKYFYWDSARCPGYDQFRQNLQYMCSKNINYACDYAFEADGVYETVCVYP